MLDVGASKGISVERLDVEDDGNDIKLEPQAGAKIRSLMNGKHTTQRSKMRGRVPL